LTRFLIHQKSETPVTGFFQPRQRQESTAPARAPSSTTFSAALKNSARSGLFDALNAGLIYILSRIFRFS